MIHDSRVLESKQTLALRVLTRYKWHPEDLARLREIVRSGYFSESGGTYSVYSPDRGKTRSGIRYGVI